MALLHTLTHSKPQLLPPQNKPPPCAPASYPAATSKGAGLAIVIAARANRAQRHTPLYLSLAVTLRTAARHYPKAAVYVVDNGGGVDGSLAELLRDRAARQPRAATLPLLLNNTLGDTRGYEMGAYDFAAHTLGWATCLPFAHVLFLQHTMALVAPLPAVPAPACFSAVFHFDDVYDSEGQVHWVRDALHALRLGPPDADPPLCNGASGTNFLLSASCLRAWLSAGALRSVAALMGSKAASQATERLSPHLARALCSCENEGGACEGQSLQGHSDQFCSDSLEELVRGENPGRYSARAFVKTMGSGVCGSVNVGEDLRRGGGKGDVWAILDAD